MRSRPNWLFAIPDGLAGYSPASTRLLMMTRASATELRLTEASGLPVLDHAVLVGNHAGRAYSWNRGYIYFFQAVDHNLFKIGRTSRSPQSRLKSLTGCPYQLELVGVFGNRGHSCRRTKCSQVFETLSSECKERMVQRAKGSDKRSHE